MINLNIFSCFFADVIVFNSYFTYIQTKAAFPILFKLMSHKIEFKIIYPCVNVPEQKFITADFSCLPLPKQLSIKTNVPDTSKLLEHFNSQKPEDRTIFLSLNRFEPKKNIELAILSYYLMIQRLQYNNLPVSNVFLFIVGGFDGRILEAKKYFDYLNELAFTHLKLSFYNVFFFTSPNNIDKQNLIHISDCVIYTPTNEHFGIVPIEAMALGKVVLAANSGGPMESIGNASENNTSLDDQFGYLRPPLPSTFSEVMLQIVNLKNSDKISNMGRLARQRVIAKYSKEVYTMHIKNLIEK